MERAQDLAAMNVSVVLPNYNHARALPRALNALLQQRLLPFEIIVVDDASTDDSIAVIRQFQQHSPLIRLIQHSENRGAPAALNSGLAVATGALIYFAAADDFTFPELFTAAAAALLESPHAAFFCSVVALISEREELLGFRPLLPPSLRSGFFSPASVRREIKRSDNWVVGPSVVYRRDLLREAGGFDVSLGSFCDGLVVRLLSLQHGFYFSSEVHGVWQRYSTSYSSRTAMSVVNATNQIVASVAKVRQIFPKDLRDNYAGLLNRRLRFNVVRLLLLWGGKSPDIAGIVAVGELNEADRRILTLFAKAPRFGAAVIMAWITLRLRPFGLSAFLRGLYVMLTRRGSYRRCFNRKYDAICGSSARAQS
jgi:glycosyltransferase involved in cell wall biosynthesis